MNPVRALLPVLLGLMMPPPNDLDMIPRLWASLPHVCTIVLTLLDTSRYRGAAQAAGADAFVAKAAMATGLVPTVQQVLQARRSAAQQAGQG